MYSINKNIPLILIFAYAFVYSETGYGISNPFSLTENISIDIISEKKIPEKKEIIRIFTGETLSIKITDKLQYNNLKIYDIQGKIVADLSKKMKRKDDACFIQFDKKTLKKIGINPGAYFVVLTGDNHQKKISRKFILVK